MNTIKQMLEVFDKKQKKKLVWITIIIFIGGLTELLGVSSILPFIEMILDSEEMMQNPYIALFCNITGIHDVNMVIVSVAIGIVLIFILKNIYVVFQAKMQYEFSYFGLRDLRCRMMDAYLHQRYPFHLNHNSAELIRNVNTDCNMFYSTVLNFLQLITEVVVCSMIGIYLIYKDAIIALGVVASMAFFMFVFMKKFRKIFDKMGAAYRVYDAGMLKCMQQSFGGIKEIKISDKEDFFQENFRRVTTDLAKNQSTNGIYNSIPKPVMETLCIGSLMLLVAIRVCMGTDPTKFVSTLSVFALGAFRLLPSINKLSGHIGVIMYDKASVFAVHKELAEIQQINQTERKENGVFMKFEKSIDVNNLTFQYEGSEYAVLQNVDLTIPKNKSVAFIGPSGAGKTTTVDLILGVLTPNSGSITVDGVDIHENMGGWHDKIGYIPQVIYMMDDTIRNNIAFGVPADEIRDEDVWAALEEAQLKDYVKSLEKGLDTEIGEMGVRLSGGQRQRIGIARALYKKPEVLVLDEATSALDNETETAVMEAIDSLQGKMTMLIIAHRLTTIKNCQIVYEIKDGKVDKKENA
jgi:ABC-type multidrug transport system fused ATPase/permease subunit